MLRLKFVNAYVVADGFEYEGERFRSLSGIAKAVTGTHISGFHFFRLWRDKMSRSKKPKTPAVRCAIYTRKSTEEGLDLEFNSLDAQRESAEAFIASQQQEGWECVEARLSRPLAPHWRGLLVRDGQSSAVINGPMPVKDSPG